jgi:hypothetical protein
MGAPDLIIPVRMEVDKALKALMKIGGAGTKAGDDIAAGARNAKKGLDDAKPAADGFGKSLLDLTRTQIGLSAIRATADAIGTAFNETAKYVQESAKQFVDLRKTMQEVASLKGSANTNQFTIQEATKAQQFHLTPQEYRDFRAQFMNYAGAQLGTGENGAVAPGAKLTTEQGEQYAGRIAELMKASGVSPAVGAELAGSLLENKQGPQNVDELIKELSRTFNVLEKGRVPLAQALPQLSRIMAYGVSATDAAKMFSIAAPAALGEEGMSVEAAMRSIQEMKSKGTGEEFGVKQGMSDYESVKAFAIIINKRTQDLIAAGKTEKEAQDAVAALLEEKKVANDVRERRGLVRGFGRQGIELGGFERYERIEQETAADFDAARKKRYEDSIQGRDDAIAAAKAVEMAKMGERNSGVARFREIAETELIAGGAFEKVQPAAELAARLPGASDARTILINQQAIRRTSAMFGETAGARDTAAAVNQGLTDQLLRELLKRLESIDEQTKIASAKKVNIGAQPPGKPLDARPPGGDNKRL